MSCNRGVTLQLVCLRVTKSTRCVWSIYVPAEEDRSDKDVNNIAMLMTSERFKDWIAKTMVYICYWLSDSDASCDGNYCFLWVDPNRRLFVIVSQTAGMSKSKSGLFHPIQAVISNLPGPPTYVIYPQYICGGENIFLVSRTFPLILSCLFRDKICLNNEGHFFPQSRISHCQNAQSKRPQCICCRE